ncbi:RteC domain-containing protein [Mucilaginibacter sp. RT5R15]|nr:RteC domain-containing protein [Mucilaginibacter flavidus]
MEMFTIETARPINDTISLKAFYEQEIRYIKRFHDTNKFLYAYYEFDMKELDHLLFVRGAKPANIPVPDIIGLDPLFTTCCDNFWGEFMAFERLEGWLHEEIKCLDNQTYTSGGIGLSFKEGFAADLKWTGDSINLVELAYGIWLTGQLNDGNAGIAEIVNWFEVHFKTKLGRPYRRWQSIAKRKRVAVTKYTDEIKKAILRRLDEENGR